MSQGSPWCWAVSAPESPKGHSRGGSCSPHGWQLSAMLPGKKADSFPREGNGRVGYTLGRISSRGCQ